MDDQTFDKKIAADWIGLIESDAAKIRDTDVYPKIQDWIDLIDPSHILDVGSGQGICASKMNLSKRNYTGVDPSVHLTERAKLLYSGEGKDFVVGSIYSLPFANNSFDAVFSIALWHLLGDLRSAASELSRVLKPNSHFLIMTANPGNYSAWTSPYSKTTLVGRRLVGQIELADGSTSSDTLYLHSYEEIENSLKAAQLEILRTEVFRNLISFYGKSSVKSFA